MTGSAPAEKKPKASPKTAPKSRKNSGSQKKVIITLCVTAAIVLLALLGTVGYYLNLTKDNGQIFANVHAAGINLGGMTPEEAANVLHLATHNTYPVQDMVVVLPDGNLILTPESTGATLDIDALVEAAFNYGRSGSRFEQYKARQKAVLTSYTFDLVPYLNLDVAYIQSAINEAATPYNTTLAQPTATIEGERPALEPENMTEETVHQVLTLTMGIPESKLDASDLYGMVLDAYSSNQFEVTPEIPTTAPDAPDLEAIYKEFCVDPVDSVLNEEDYTASSELYGYGFEIETVKALVAVAEPGQSLEIELQYFEPAVTKESIESQFFQDVLGTYTAYQYSASDRATNLRLACQYLNGTLVKPGATFSFNGAVGERTKEKGYKEAATYLNGKTVQQTGGGICQVSTAVYYSTLLADLDIVERECHAYPSSYVPIGLDATVSWGSLDYQFRNDTDYPIRIEAIADGGSVTVTLYGTETKDYYVKLGSEILETYDYETIYEEMDEDNEEGYKDGDIIQKPHTGYKAVSYMYKYNKETGAYISREIIDYSTYRMTDEIICKIKVPETLPPETTTPETDPPETTTPETDPDPSETTEPGLEGEVGDGGVG